VAAEQLKVSRAITKSVVVDEQMVVRVDERVVEQMDEQVQVMEWLE
jgi:hypothetical protein